MKIGNGNDLSRYIKGLNLNISTLNRYKFDKINFTLTGKLKFRNLIELQKTVAGINESRKSKEYPERTVKAGVINAITQINEAYQIILSVYQKQYEPDLMEKMQDFLKNYYDQNKFDLITQEFDDLYTVDIKITENKKTTFQIFFPELLVIWLNNQNPAFNNYHEFFNDNQLAQKTSYPDLIEFLEFFFDQKSYPGNKDKNLIHFLREPTIRFPGSISKQISFIIDNWSSYLGDFLQELLKARDIIREEQKTGFTGPGPAEIYRFSGEDDEYEKFSPDSDWMPNLVLIAKSTYVWLDQLSKKYKREIKNFQEIPDEELELLSRHGFTGLWLIGIWQRSEASRRIKHINGDQEAIASAYSLSDYSVADDLGGEIGMHELQERAWKYGIRVACDMVPNHMGIDSQWIIDHPDWFLQLPYSPYPAYSFSGENLSVRSEITVQLEDHYRSKSDAAVVFKLTHHKDNSIRYIYHGNDGTSVPWNDTAQLDFLNPEVREALIRVIVDIARRFPIIRFDAAMTLAKRHIHRLWFPQPGTGGDIPSRAEFGMTKVEFDQKIPHEFWREVVDRVAEEAPDTLLLAEAFWMMEGYFVRTLGIHRVYNSAFMNMLKNEENAKYRKSIFNILEFNPEILKRFVNFMSNPDEDTAIAQFGNNDKYFGVCVLMVTMPGLPMFAHGQIEGFQERYGMEFSRARIDEAEDNHLIDRHRKEIFPLLRKRPLFSDVKNFLLYDFIQEDGTINENVFAYSNEYLSRKSLVLFHNKFEDIKGWVRETSRPLSNDQGVAWEKVSLGSAFKFTGRDDYYVIYRDQISNMEFIRNSREITELGLFKELGAFKYSVLLDFREVKDENGFLAKIADYLQGGGSDNIDRSINKIRYDSIIQEFTEFFKPQILNKFIQLRRDGSGKQKESFLSETRIRSDNLLNSLQGEFCPDQQVANLSDEIISNLRFWLDWKVDEQSNDNLIDLILISWIVISKLLKIKPAEENQEIPLEWINELYWAEIIAGSLQELQYNVHALYLEALLISLLKHQHVWKRINIETDHEVLRNILEEKYTKIALNINRFQDILWFDDKLISIFLRLLQDTNIFTLKSFSGVEKEYRSSMQDLNRFIENVLSAKLRSEYKVEKLISELKELSHE